MVPFCPVPFCPKVPFCPNTPCSILPPRLRLGKSHYVNYNSGRCSIKWYENENKRYIIIFNHMQRFYYLICQSNWCHNASKLIYQKGEISFLWHTQNVVYCKFDFDVWRWTGRRQKSNGRENRPTPGRLFSKHPVFHFAPMFHFAPPYYIWYHSNTYAVSSNWSRLSAIMAMPSPITQLFIQQLAHVDINQNIKHQHHSSLVRGIHRRLVDSKV